MARTRFSLLKIHPSSHRQVVRGSDYSSFFDYDMFYNYSLRFCFNGIFPHFDTYLTWSINTIKVTFVSHNILFVFYVRIFSRSALSGSRLSSIKVVDRLKFLPRGILFVVNGAIGCGSIDRNVFIDMVDDRGVDCGTENLLCNKSIDSSYNGTSITYLLPGIKESFEIFSVTSQSIVAFGRHRLSTKCLKYNLNTKDSMPEARKPKFVLILVPIT